MAKIDRIEHTIELPEGVSASIADGVLTVKGPKGEVSREFQSSRLVLLQDGAGLMVRVDLPRRKEKALAGTWNAHIRNMVKGVSTGFSYTLRCFYSHFPMTMKVEGSEFVVNNYFGERVPRRADILSGVDVRVENKTDVIVSGIDKEAVGQTAANIERSTTVKNRDRRVFQDGIYRVSKE
ncbi:MAG: 50S ribosomal protein L6 [Euryarchaeota archaeon]|nr:50S ribosomal protein L6 [Euryarchaeota archaeon]DAC35688.1 MAG TPA: 50S ribosomal protein L6 [Candidatus Poseidoniales archaeon]|tara:strand:- start:1985 stop:2524 length:540 start_codon:yes stop_codon:yes gene_type:complete